MLFASQVSGIAQSGSTIVLVRTAVVGREKWMDNACMRDDTKAYGVGKGEAECQSTP